ncbi:tyrosine-type recombinase/integrase [Bacillus chungangensis]|uniref:tyrosine-type recombinase/integrase n=1 Tax=Bacillus chungangensis TaxID=587633 RepID=UPI0027D8E6AC|nr:tyrosine-type recombinase/integrase [Bacillus chungangensis]
MPNSSLFNAFFTILKKAGLPRVPIHSLRHTHTVILLEAGVDLKYVQERLGHKSIQITATFLRKLNRTQCLNMKCS